MGRLAKLGGLCLVFYFLNTGACEEERGDGGTDNNHIGTGGKKYGEECSSSYECNEQELLGCQNGLCTCIPFTSLIYEDELRRCVGKVGEKCGGGIIRSSGWTVYIPCVEGALCDESSGGCVCTDDYFRLPNSTCTKKKKYMELCQGDHECGKDYRSTTPFICQDGVCDCDKKKQMYDEDRKQCVTLVGGECHYIDKITSTITTSSTTTTTTNRYNNECSSHAICGKNNKCECIKNYIINTKKQCSLGYGQSCGIGKLCSDLELACLDGICTCKYPLHQIYDHKSELCLSLVSGPCTLNDTNNNYDDDNNNHNNNNNNDNDENSIEVIHIQKCTKNAICVDQGFFTGCECLDGFVQKKNGECSPGYGETCEADECDPITPLYCRNNKCDCRDELQMFDVERRKCLGLVGSRCILGQNSTQPVKQCVEFCSCVKVGVELEGKCLCDKYSEEVENRTCIYNT